MSIQFNNLSNKRVAALNDQALAAGIITGIKHTTHADSCSRCSGRGGSEAWKFTGFTCYRCAGNQVDPTNKIVKLHGEPTADFIAFVEKREESRIKRAETAEAKRVAKLEAVRAAWLAAWSADAELQIVTEQIGSQHIWTRAVEIYEDLQRKGKQPTEKQRALLIKCAEEAVERAAEQIAIDAAKADSDFVGTVGERVRDMVVTFEDEFSFDGYYGTTYVLIFRDADGNAIKWMTSSPSINACEGDTVVMTATIKEHSSYNGEKQTLVTRCKFIEAAEVA